MAVSQNGWTVISSAVVRQVEGSRVRLSVRPGPAGDLLMYVAREFDRRVEDIDTARGVVDDGGWVVRTIAGSNQYSNHASGTAIDLNWTRHPAGAVGTFTRTQVATIGQILAEVGSAVRWGGNYVGRKDEMHFEINADATRVAVVAAALAARAPAQEADVSMSTVTIPKGFAYDLSGDNVIDRNLIASIPGEWANQSWLRSLGPASVSFGCHWTLKRVKLRVEYAIRGRDGKEWFPRVNDVEIGGDVGRCVDWVHLPDGAYMPSVGRITGPSYDSDGPVSMTLQYGHKL